MEKYTEYHHIVATIIQREWKNYILRKKIWCMLKPRDKISISRKLKDSVAVNDAFIRIHSRTTYFRTFIVTYNNEFFDVKKLHVNYKQNNMYYIYKEGNDNLFLLNRKQIGKMLKTLNNILSIKLEGIVTDTNFYGYPELVHLKFY